MNTHKHARLTFARRLEMVKQMTLEGFDAVQAAAVHGVTAPTARKWLGRYLAGGQAALADASSRPLRSPRAIDAGKALLIVELIKRRMLQARIAPIEFGRRLAHLLVTRQHSSSTGIPPLMQRCARVFLPRCRWIRGAAFMLHPAPVHGGRGAPRACRPRRRAGSGRCRKIAVMLRGAHAC